jgi:hypothetical protein
MPSSGLGTERRSDVSLLVMQGTFGGQIGGIVVEDHANTVFPSVNDFSNASQTIAKKSCLLLAELVF